MSDIVERLKTTRCWMRHQGMAIVTDDAPFEAADEIERLRAENARARQIVQERLDALIELDARLAEAVEVLLDVNDAAQIDVLMEGPRLQGWRRSELDRLWPKLRAFLAKLEARS